MWTTGLLFLSLSNLGAAQVEIFPLDNQSLFLENHGSALLYKSSWKIFSQLSIIDEHEALRFAQNCKDHAEKICERTRDYQSDNMCPAWIEEIAGVTKEITFKLNGLHTLLSPLSRKKRGLLNFGGKIANFVFGTMDSSDSENIYAKLDSLEKHDVENLHLMQKQISLVKSTTSNLGTVLDKIHKNEAILINRTQELESRITQEIFSQNKIQNLIHLKADANDLISFVILTLQQISHHLSEQYIILNTLLIGKIHPLIIHPQTLLNLTHTIAQQYHTHKLLQEITILSQITHVQFVLNKTKIHIRIDIPLVEPKEYSIHQAYPLPSTQGSNITTVIDMEPLLLLTSHDNQTYIKYTTTDFQNACEKLAHPAWQHLRICKQTQVKVIGIDKTDCILSIIHNVMHDNSCRHRIITNGLRMFTKLAAINSWLFTFSTQQQLRIQCPHRLYLSPLKGTGIITFTQPCSFTLGYYEIPYEDSRSQEILSHTFYSYYPKKLKYSQSVPTQENLTSSIYPQVIESHQYYDLIKSNSKDLDEFSKTLDQTELNRQVEKHSTHSLINSIGLISILLVLLILVFKTIKSCKDKTTNKSAVQVQFQPTPISQPTYEEPRRPKPKETRSKSFRVKI